MMSAMEKPEVSALAKTVLIVEDNELNMKLFHDLLELLGVRVVAPGHPVEGAGRGVLRDDARGGAHPADGERGGRAGRCLQESAPREAPTR